MGLTLPAHDVAVWLLLILNISGKVAALCFVRSAPGLALALWFVPDGLLAYFLFYPHAQGLVTVYRRFRTRQREVWLTIDDGPDPEDTPRILHLLKQHGARATFFVIGRKAAAHPELIRALLEAGHEVAHHTHTHPVGSFWCASRARTARELDEGLAVLPSGEQAPTRFRPPVGFKNLWLASALAERRLTCIGWTARGLERQGGDADAVADRVLRRLEPGNILLLHEGPRLPSAIRVEAIRCTLERLTAMDYRLVIPTAEQLSIQ